MLQLFWRSWLLSTILWTTVFIPVAWCIRLKSGPNAPITECQTVTFSWEGGPAPYRPGIFDDNDDDQALFTFGPTNALNMTWKVNITAGTVIFYCDRYLRIEDNAFDKDESDDHGILPGKDRSCINAASNPQSNSSSSASASKSTTNASRSSSTPTQPVPSSGLSNSIQSPMTTLTSPPSSSPSSPAASTASSPSHTGMIVGSGVGVLLFPVPPLSASGSLGSA
ncbi:hypothetical protein AMATHDRAFT_51091 [Amanita thiersii Skay4041]|uniref:Uncharacterized protein n=1 Tax=Amanita thiersii Skay4041 TaxID=703135 RepID=A0A2A9NFE4_9AGAR|nr:hypothetical protein AMATHDRAFT_51091 [Amanita thiersii Skay4041]